MFDLSACFSYLHSGGPVMWPMLGCSVLMLWLAAGLLFRPAAYQPELKPTGVSWLDERRAQLSQQQWLQHQQEQLQSIRLLATTAPLLGLLGTVSGMITMFRALAQSGLHDGNAISDGIAMAMISTQTGLLIGAPGLLLAYLWQRRLGSQQQRIASGAHYAQ
ncbi:MotA/TolQ/ExbB proton channel family protein [Ferrimonas lipolytica]|uniref:MotA/TolQ/ExbB proton channel family protein n=1 Tax=Ferrimonas lipolytica TaxID=2724191 RepID=A0A6H1UK29_9GAMM|nr:MotA/TolQ/ExbB proton channel family protein [Ferrimonas lipolytica]QIZ78673.1 MotA/TolQ/ExbB proton channel family protein [Ferrimonas lipolytica]